MDTIWPKPLLFSIIFTALIYLISLTIISNPYILVVLKPLPILGMLYAVWQSTSLRKMRYVLMLALLFSILGDIVLALPITLTLELGIGCFFVAHCCYSFLLLCAFHYNRKQLFFFGLIFLGMCAGISILYPYLGDFRIPVIIYFLVLALMVLSSLQVCKYQYLAGSGALLFLLSDTILAFSLFVYPMVDMRFAIMLTYYSAQLLLTTFFLLLYSNSNKS